MESKTIGDDRLPEEISVWRAIGLSWMAMKTWVKVWLFLLNGLFLLALVFLPRPSAWYILLGYLASGPLLLGFMLIQRGLTRLLGLAHLIPWIPLLVYLVLRLTTTSVGPRIAFAGAPLYTSYLITLTAAVGVCLALDVLDVVRWLRGERYVLGSPAAAEAGASYEAPVNPSPHVDQPDA